MSIRLVKWMRVTTVACLLTFAMTPFCAADPKTIVAFGDSTTAARGDLQVYCNRLQTGLPRRNMPVRVINAGVAGHHTQDAREHFEKHVLAHDPDIVIIQFGINDSAIDVWKNPPATEPRVALEDYENNLRHFIHVLRERMTAVVLMTPNPVQWTPKMRSMYGKPPHLTEREDGFNAGSKRS